MHKSGFNPFKSGRKSSAVIEVTDRVQTATRSYRNRGGYTPKNYATRPHTAAYKKLLEKKEQRRLDEEKQKATLAMSKRSQTPKKESRGSQTPTR